MARGLAEVRVALQGRYAIERELGRGGMATVYLAEDLKLHRPVALKLLHPELGATLGPERFLREIAIASRLTHPNILQLYDSGEADGRLFYAMPYVEGESLRERLRREPQLPVDETVAIVRAVATALDYAHRAGVIHRDIKPENILLAKGSGTGLPHVLVADFGIARALHAAGGERLTETGLALGTPAYMSPDQASASRHLDGRSDIYALGCVAYEMLAGAPPFTGPTAQAILARHAVDPVPPLRTVRSTVPPAVERAVDRALAKVPADRFATAAEFAAALVTDQTQVTRPRWRPTARPTRLVGGMLGVVVATAAGAWMLRGDPSPAVAPAAASIAVLPLVSASADTALTRLGRDLAVTISATLDGVGGIKTTDRLSVATATADRPNLSTGEGAVLARRLGASSLLRGTLVRAGDNVRVDLGLYATEGLAPLAEGITVSGHRDSIGPLTDSVAWALLRQVWQRGRPPSPSLDAVTTHSLPALRAFLQGERELGANDWDNALLSFQSAVAADSSFGMAQFRYALARWWNENGAEPESLSVLRLQRDRFPERERLLIDGFLLSLSAPRPKIERYAVVTRRFPDYWPGWFLYADAMYHQGPNAGYDWSEVLNAFHRVVALNPTLVPAWLHIFDLTTGRNRFEAANAFAKLSELGWLASQPPGARLRAELQAAVDSSGGSLSPQADRLIDSFAQLMPSTKRAITLEEQLAFEPVFLLESGFPSAQLELNRRALATGRLVPPVARALRAADAWAWAARGRWDSALTIMSALAEAQAGPSVGVRAPEGAAYQLAVLGAWLGATAPSLADQRRPAAVTSIGRMEEGRRRNATRASIAWLDGLLGFTRGDRLAIKAARKDAAGSGYYQAELVDRSLDAFHRALAGDRKAAGRKLAELEEYCVEHEDCNSFVPLFTVQRLAAAQWLSEAGALDEAGRLLRWQDQPWNGCTECDALGGPNFLARAQIEVARGDSGRAREYYRQFLRRYDRPMASQMHLVQEANAALTRLAGDP
ncbi:MAG: protein kinase domain-containing protein [Gemmatimonadales bacterium]